MSIYKDALRKLSHEVRMGTVYFCAPTWDELCIRYEYGGAHLKLVDPTLSGPMTQTAIIYALQTVNFYMIVSTWPRVIVYRIKTDRKISKEDFIFRILTKYM